VTDTIDVVAGEQDKEQQRRIAQELVDKARRDGVDLVGPDGLLAGLTKQVLETALETELTDHVGYEKHDPGGRDGGNSRNGYRSKTVLTEIGPVQIGRHRPRCASCRSRRTRRPKARGPLRDGGRLPGSGVRTLPRLRLSRPVGGELPMDSVSASSRRACIS
jgi:putative transposase